VPVVPKGSFSEQLDGKNDGNCQKQIQLEFANRTEMVSGISLYCEIMASES